MNQLSGNGRQSAAGIPFRPAEKKTKQKKRDVHLKFWSSISLRWSDTSDSAGVVLRGGAGRRLRYLATLEDASLGRRFRTAPH